MQQLFGESSDEFEGKPPEVVSFDEFVKVHAKQISGNAKVTTEIKALVEVHYAVLFVRILGYDQHCTARLVVRLTHSFSFCRMLTSTRAC